MNKLRYLAFIFSLIINYGVAQTTDLSVVVEAQDLSGNEISQAHIYEEFQYIVTIINTVTLLLMLLLLKLLMKILRFYLIKVKTNKEVQVKLEV